MKATSVVLVLSCLLCFVVATKMVSLKMDHSYLHKDHHLFHHFNERRGSNFASIENSQMGGNIYPVGIYYVAVDLGTPAQSMLVAVDSGSSDLLVPSSTCKGCHEQNTGAFNTTSSSTISNIACTNHTVKCKVPCNGQCSFSNSYQTCNLTAPQQVCTVTGPLYSDIYAQGGLSASVIFGVIESQTKNFQQFYNIDGVIGFAFPAGSSWGGTPPIDRLVQAGEIADSFAMCLQPNAGGVLTIGGTDPKLYTGTFQYTPMLRYFGEYILYVLDLTDVQISEQTIGLPATDYKRYGTMGGCVLDSGTNTILFPVEIYGPWLTSFNNYWNCPSSTAPPGVCDGTLVGGTAFQYSTAQINSFPNIQLVFNGVTLEIDGADYIVNNGTASWYRLGVLNTGAGGNLIVGDVLMQNYYVEFDRKNKRVGWATPQLQNCIGIDTPLAYYPQ